MSTLSHDLSLDPKVRQALVDALHLKLPPGERHTLEQIETASLQLLRELGPQLITDTLQGVNETPKKGALLQSVADAPPSSKACKNEQSPR